MLRRDFIQGTGMVAFGIGVFGKISWENGAFIGDNPTTTDILGPFYRPNAPMRSNINPKGYTGPVFHLTGKIYKADGKTPFPNCLVEIWQCDEHKVYDNTTDDYRYRGSQRVGKDGRYHFMTTTPLPYPINSAGVYRPAHIHMRLSGEGQQDLITQIYFKDDPHIEKDPSAGSAEAINRILTTRKNSKKEDVVTFNVVMQKEFKPSTQVYTKLTGIYTMDDHSMLEFYKDGDMLFVKRNGQIREGLKYIGNNSFEGGAAGTDHTKVSFDLVANGDVKVKIDVHDGFEKSDKKIEGVKTFKY